MTKLEEIKAQAKAAMEDPNMPSRLHLFRAFRDNVPWLLERLEELVEVAKEIEVCAPHRMSYMARKALAKLEE